MTNVLWHQCSVTKRFSHLFLSPFLYLFCQWVFLFYLCYLTCPCICLSLSFFVFVCLSLLISFSFFCCLSVSVIITLYLCIFCSYFLLFNQINKQLMFLFCFSFILIFMCPKSTFLSVCLPGSLNLSLFIFLSVNTFIFLLVFRFSFFLFVLLYSHFLQLLA